MSRTIGRTWPSDAPKGDVRATCSYCGVRYRRSQLRKDRAGLLACDRCGDGRDVVTLSELNALAAASRHRTDPIDGGGNYNNNALTEGLMLDTDGNPIFFLVDGIPRVWKYPP